MQRTLAQTQGRTSGYDGVLTTLDPDIWSGEAMDQSSNDMTYLLSNMAVSRGLGIWVKNSGQAWPQ